jgi:hypothetical protein
MHKSVLIENFDNIALESIKELNLSSLIISDNDVLPETLSKVKESMSDIEIYVAAAVFKNLKLAKKYPDSLPVDSTGKDLNNQGWVCPTHEKAHSEILDNLKTLVSQDIDGIWLNDLQYPTIWNVSEPDILDTCYCDRCLRKFEEYIGEPIEGVGGEGTDLENTALYIDGSYYHEWLEFKASQINFIVSEVVSYIKQSGKDIKLGMFIIPWKDKEHGAGIQRVVAQDFSKLIDWIDVFSPMLLHKSCGKDVNWVAEMIEHFWLLGKPLLPLVEDAKDIPTQEFEEVLKNATTAPSIGVCVINLQKADYLKSLKID